MKINCDVSRYDRNGNWLGGLVYDTDTRRRGYDEDEEYGGRRDSEEDLRLLERIAEMLER